MGPKKGERVCRAYSKQRGLRIFALVFVQRGAVHEPPRDLSCLMARPRSGGMGSEIARSRDEDHPGLGVALPGEVLPHGGLQILHHVKSRVLAQERVTEKRNKHVALTADGKVAGGKLRCLRNLLLAVASSEKSLAKLRR